MNPRSTASLRRDRALAGRALVGRAPAAAMVLLLVLQNVSPAWATIYTWNAGSGLTNTSVNWSPNTGTPGANDDTRFWQGSITYGITMAAPTDTFSTLWGSSNGTLKFICSDPLRVRNQFNVDGGVTASVTSGFARAGWFTIGPGSLTITGNGTQAAATNPTASTYVGSSSGFTSTLNISGGAGFQAPIVYAPEFTNTTGIIAVAGHVTNGPSSTLHLLSGSGANSGSLYLGNQGVGDLELSNGGVAKVDFITWLGPYAYGKLHMFRTSSLTPLPLLTLNALKLGRNFVAGSPGGSGTFAVDQGLAAIHDVFTGDDDGGGPDTLRMTGGTVWINSGLVMSPTRTGVLDLRGGTLVVHFGDYAIDIEQAVPVAISGGHAMTVYCGGTGSFGDFPITQIATTSPTSLLLGRNSGGTFRVIGSGFDTGFDVYGAAVLADSLAGTGTIVADSGATCGVRGLSVGPGNGVVTVRRGSWLGSYSNEADFVGGASTGAAALVSDTLSTLQYLTIGIGGNASVAVPGGATVTVDSSASLGASLVRVWKGGGHLLVKNRASCLVDSVLASGNVELAAGTVQTSLHGAVRSPVRITDTGTLHGTGTVLARVQLADTTASLAILGTDPAGGTLTVGDSAAADGFTSSGTVEVDQDTLVLLNHGQAPLGHVVLGGGTLRLPQGGHVRAQDVLEGTAGRIEGDLLVDGQLRPSGALYAAGHVTCLSGALTGSYLEMLPGSELSMRGMQAGTVRNGGRLDMGPVPALLTLTATPTFLSTSDLVIRIGSAASHVEDTLALTHAVTLNGTLDLRTWKPAPPQAGDTLTVLTAPSITGTFSAVTIDSVNAPSFVQAIYSPTSVRVAILRSTAGVPPAPVSPAVTALRFAVVGPPARPALELDLPAAATAEAALYDVGGRRVASLIDGTLPPGRHRFDLAGANLASGVYFARARVTSVDGTHVLGARFVRLR